MHKLLLIALGFLLSEAVHASSQEPVCLKYKKEYGWSPSYSVEAKIMSGSDLSSATGNYTRFRAFSTYAVVFWSNDQATILELPSSALGSVPAFSTSVRDQEGREWKINQSNGFCF
ncbi:hypothetical protein [Pseudomonas abyssi]|uniref:hypothetical protein n=1 Tax=Pseudomonas abyssi TaxID=170540 RepID=UPI0011C11DEE|nr:hypothetical protein [Halopseudomonas gallaeciensis]